jgi:hypothetical protein
MAADTAAEAASSQHVVHHARRRREDKRRLGANGLPVSLFQALRSSPSPVNNTKQTIQTARGRFYTSRPSSSDSSSSSSSSQEELQRVGPSKSLPDLAVEASSQSKVQRALSRKDLAIVADAKRRLTTSPNPGEVLVHQSDRRACICMPRFLRDNFFYCLRFCRMLRAVACVLELYLSCRVSPCRRGSHEGFCGCW